MKRVLVVAPDFVPSSMPPSLRIRFMINHLYKYGWEATVICTEPEYYEWNTDNENNNLISENIRIIRTKAFSSKLTRLFGIGDLGIRTFWFIWKEIEKICSREKFDALLISVPPYYTMPLGRLIKKKYDIPYILDYQDPWVTEYYWKLPRKKRPPKWILAYYTSRMLEKYSIKYISGLIGVSKGTTDSVISNYSWLQKNIAYEIPLGCEEEDFKYILQNPRANNIFDKDDHFIHISYIGVCIESMYPSINVFFQAIKKGLKNKPKNFKRIRIHFVGTDYSNNAQQKIIPIAKKYGLEPMIDEETKRVSYLDAIQILLDSDMLVAFGTEEAHYTASKMFPYILSKKPIFTIFHELSTVVDILKETKSGECITFKNVEDLSSKTNEVYSKLLQKLENYGKYNCSTDWSKFRKYNSESIAEKLSSVLNKLI